MNEFHEDEGNHKHKTKQKNKGKIKIISGGKQANDKNVFVFKTEEDADPIIIKDGIEIDTIEDLSGDEIESITVLKAKDAIEKYGADGAHGAIETKGKKKDQP